MSNANLDPSTLSTSADIFSGSHTLPQIRSIHKNIHVQIDEKATRLRTQVGSSYRELLGTADTIVQMRRDNEAVQELLGKLGAQCGRTVVGRKVSGLAEFSRGQTRPEMAEAARVKLLERCGLVIGRILKGGGGLGEGLRKGDRLVVAAKILVLSRLLFKSLGDELIDSRLREDVDAVKKTHESLRRRFLRNTQKVLEAATEEDDDDREDVLKALCAYSLATSSSARNVLRQYLRIREEAITVALGIGEERHVRSQEDVIRGLRLYTRSLLDVQALFPNKLSQALIALKKTPLLADPTLMQLNGLRLDVFERWCGEEIQYFTPFIHHDDLDVSQAKDMLMSWARVGGGVLLSGVKAMLDQMNEFKSIMELRTAVLQLWIRDGARVRGFDPSDMQDKLREAINARMLALLESKVNKLRLVRSEIEATLENWFDGITDKHKSLWDEDGYDMSLSNGAAPFMEEVVSRLYGRNDAVSKASNSYATWFQVIDDVKAVVESLRKQRWDNDYDEIEDEETIEERQQALSKDDPDELQEKLDTTLDKAYLELDERITELWEKNWDKSNRGAIAIYLLRVLREIRNKLPARTEAAGFGLEMIPGLQKAVVDKVATGPMNNFGKIITAGRDVVGRPLWEGEPSLPGQPSPQVFEFLRNLSVSMGDAGMDLWGPAAVKIMKEYMVLRLGEVWKEALAVVEKESTSAGVHKKIADKDVKDAQAGEGKEDGADVEEGEEEEDEDEEEEEEVKKASGELALTEERKRDLHIQWLFDVAYLGTCVRGEAKSGQAPGTLKEVENSIFRATGLEEASRGRIVKSAESFWQRTNLLFGLLAQ
jgi:hypothetical protein